MVYFNKKSSALASHVSLSSILVVHDRSSSPCTFSFLPVVPILQPEMGITVQIIGSWKFGNDLLPRKRETAIHSSTPLPHHSINKNMPHSCYAVLFHRAKKLAAFVASQFCLILSLKGKIIWRSIVVLSLPGQQPAPAKICFWPIFTNRLYNNSVVVSSKSRGATAGRQRKCPGGVLQRLAGFNRE